MRTHSWTKVLIGAAALVALAACNSSPSVETEPGQIDWDMAVTRTAFDIGADRVNDTDSGHRAYSPWSHEVFEISGEEPGEPASVEHLETGLEFLCGEIEHGEQWLVRSLLGYVVRDAVHGAVLASASDEFREANHVLFVYEVTSRGGDVSQEVDDAWNVMTGDLHEEWVELYALQTELQQEVDTLEGTQAAHSAVAERCNFTINEADVVDSPAERVGPILVRQPGAPASEQDE